MSSGFVEIEQISGADGGLAGIAQAFHGLNDGLTWLMDHLEGPDGTDAFDASCNTCAHFQREKFDRRERLVSIWGFPGTCAETGKSVTGWPRGQFVGHACYENRRTGSRRTSKGAR